MARSSTGDCAAAVAGGAGLTRGVVGGCGALGVEAAVCSGPHSALPVGADGLRVAVAGGQAEAG